MITPSPEISRRLPFRLLRRIARHTRVRIGPRLLEIPTHSPAAIDWIYWQPTWKSAAIAKLLHAKPGPFVDVGASTGQTLADFLAADLAQPYLGIEPNPVACGILTEIAALNRLRDVSIVSTACTDATGLVKLHLLASDPIDPTASLHADLRPCTPRGTVWTTSQTLDRLLPAAGIAHPALIKIDVEGAEMSVLAGAAGSLAVSRPWILCEVLLADRNADLIAHEERTHALARFLDEHRYRIFQLVKEATPGALPLLRPIAAFPAGTWTPARGEECDYLFGPAEETPPGFRFAP